jgi:hypothetical protein
MKFTIVKLIDEKKVVPARLLPEQEGDYFTWQIDDKDILNYNTKTKEFTLDIYEFIDEDWEQVKSLDHADSYQVALDEGIIYE